MLYVIDKVKALTDNQIRFYAVEILCGISLMHERGNVHCDLKPNNIFVTKDGHLRIADFGNLIKIKPGECGFEFRTKPSYAVRLITFKFKVFCY